MSKRQCAYRMPDGSLCQAPPLRDGRFCFFHDPVHAEDAKEVHRLGGLRRKREATVAGAYDFEGLTSIARIRRLLDIASVDAFSLDNSVARIRALIAIALAAAKLLEIGELEERVKTLEAAMAAHRHDDDEVFDFEPTTLKLLDTGAGAEGDEP